MNCRISGTSDSFASRISKFMTRAMIAVMRKMMLVGAIVFDLTISAQSKGELGVGSGEWKKPKSSASTPTPHTQPPTPHRFDVHVTPEMIRHSRIYDVLYFVDFAYGIGVLLLVLRA